MLDVFADSKLVKQLKQKESKPASKSEPLLSAPNVSLIKDGPRKSALDRAKSHINNSWVKENIRKSTADNIPNSVIPTSSFSSLRVSHTDDMHSDEDESDDELKAFLNNISTKKSIIDITATSPSSEPVIKFNPSTLNAYLKTTSRTQSAIPLPKVPSPTIKHMVIPITQPPSSSLLRSMKSFNNVKRNEIALVKPIDPDGPIKLDLNSQYADKGDISVDQLLFTPKGEEYVSDDSISKDSSIGSDFDTFMKKSNSVVAMEKPVEALTKLPNEKTDNSILIDQISEAVLEKKMHAEISANQDCVLERYSESAILSDSEDKEKLEKVETVVHSPTSKADIQKRLEILQGNILSSKSIDTSVVSPLPGEITSDISEIMPLDVSDADISEIMPLDVSDEEKSEVYDEEKTPTQEKISLSEPIKQTTATAPKLNGNFNLDPHPSQQAEMQPQPLPNMHTSNQQQQLPDPSRSPFYNPIYQSYPIAQPPQAFYPYNPYTPVSWQGYQAPSPMMMPNPYQPPLQAWAPSTRPAYNDDSDTSIPKKSHRKKKHCKHHHHHHHHCSKRREKETKQVLCSKCKKIITSEKSKAEEKAQVDDYTSIIEEDISSFSAQNSLESDYLEDNKDDAVSLSTSLGSSIASSNKSNSKSEAPKYTNVKNSILNKLLPEQTLELLTNLNPNMAILNDILKGHVEMIENFVGMTQRVNYINGAITRDRAYKYTTLEDTRRFIKKNRKKTIGFEEALKKIKDDEFKW